MKQSTPFVLLFGGIGNRLFQIARARDLKQQGLNPCVADIEEFAELQWMTEKILHWTQHPLWLDSRELARSLGLRQARPSFQLRVKIYSGFLKALILKRRLQYTVPLPVDTRNVQVGYFQTLEATTDDSIIAVANAVFSMVQKWCSPVRLPVIHWRAGDFAITDVLATEIVKDFISTNGKSVCVTNDAAYVRARFPEVIVSSSSTPEKDFATLCCAKIILPSNSTFCFWASVIAVQNFNAKLWFRPADEYWIKLKGVWINHND